MTMAHAIAMRYLEKAVLGRHRPDLHRLEQNVVTRIARHDFPRKHLKFGRTVAISGSASTCLGISTPR
jgi:hypothetical protein